jgi:hypothetical protein
MVLPARFVFSKKTKDEMQRIEREFAGRKLVIETGRMAKQASGSAVVQFGETSATRKALSIFSRCSSSIATRHTPLEKFRVASSSEREDQPIPRFSRRESSIARFVPCFLKDSRTKSRSSFM